MKNLQNYGVQEMNANETRNTDGGWESFGILLLDEELWKTALGFLAGLGDGIREGME
jgi:hypothetical protein